MVVRVGVEPTFTRYKQAVLPLNYQTINLEAPKGLEPFSLAYEAKLEPLQSTVLLESHVGVEPTNGSFADCCVRPLRQQDYKLFSNVNLVLCFISCIGIILTSSIGCK
jgi:hypothetical protein